MNFCFQLSHSTSYNLPWHCIRTFHFSFQQQSFSLTSLPLLAFLLMWMSCHLHLSFSSSGQGCSSYYSLNGSSSLHCVWSLTFLKLFMHNIYLLFIFAFPLYVNGLQVKHWPHCIWITFAYRLLIIIWMTLVLMMHLDYFSIFINKLFALSAFFAIYLLYIFFLILRKTSDYPAQDDGSSFCQLRQVSYSDEC